LHLVGFSLYLRYRVFGSRALGKIFGPKRGEVLVVVFISNCHRVLNVVFFLLRNSPASEFYMPTFRNAVSVPSS